MRAFLLTGLLVSSLLLWFGQKVLAADTASSADTVKSMDIKSGDMEVQPRQLETISNIRIEEPPKASSEIADQLIGIQFAPFRPASVAVNNGSYRFDYGSGASSVMGELNWAVRLVSGFGSLYLQEGIAATGFGGNVVQSGQVNTPDSSYSMGLAGLDSRLMFALDALPGPGKYLIPFADFGYQYSLYYQPGKSGLDSAQGGVGNVVGGLGLRFWLNRAASLGGSTPWYLTAKLNRIFPDSDPMNLTSTSVFGGLALGF